MQALCKRCHDLKTYSETRSTAEKNIIIKDPVNNQAFFVVIVGPSGSGRHAHADAHYSDHIQISAHIELEKIAGHRYECASNWEIIAAYRERNIKIKEATQTSGSYVIICDEPSAIKRRLFVQPLRAPVVIIDKESMRDHPFYSRLSTDKDDKTVRC